MKISAKLYLSTAISIGLICLLAIFVFQSSLQIKTAQQKADIANQLVSQATYLTVVLDEYLAYQYERSEQQWEKVSTSLSELAGQLLPEDTRFIQRELGEIKQVFPRLQLAYRQKGLLIAPSQMVAAHDLSKDIKNRLSSQIRVSSQNILSRAFMLSQQAGKDIQAINQSNLNIVLRVSIILILLLVVSSFLVISGISKPLKVLINAAEKIEEGHLSEIKAVEVSHLRQNSQSEIGKLTRSFASMTEQLTGTIQSLQSSEKRYRSLFETVGVSLWEEDYSEIQTMFESLRRQSVADIPTYIREHPEFVAEAARALKILEVNDATLKLFHADSKEQLLGSLDQVFVPESFPVFCEELVAIAEEREFFESEAVNGTLNGDSINVLMTVNFPSEFKELGRLTVSIADITELKKAEKSLAQHRNQLEQRVEERTNDLVVKTEQLKKSEQALVYLLEDVNASRAELQKVNSEYAEVNKELKEFAYIVSHDLKAPLRAISQLTHWIAEDYSTAFDAEGKMQMDLIIQRAKRMDNLIDGILRYSRLGRGREKAESLDLNILVQQVIDTIAADENVKVIIEDKLPVISRDSIRMEQVFQNLIGNAISYTDKAECIVRVGCVEDEMSWTFSVADNGPGIDPQYHEKIFQIFQTLTSRDERESTGIGLALVKKIIRIYGGSVWLESEAGCGATFFFTLPKKGGEDEEL